MKFKPITKELLMIELKAPPVPAYLKAGFFGATKSGKTHTVAKMLSQFVKQYVPDSQVAMFDTEPSAGYVASIVKQITGKDLLAFTSRSFSDLMDFTNLCIDKKYVALIDSMTHPWKNLMADYLTAKKSRVKSAGGNPDTTILTVKDYGPLKDIWGQFTELFAYAPLHIAIIGREGDVWENVTDEEGKQQLTKTG
jgi:hypothetical protein